MSGNESVNDDFKGSLPHGSFVNLSKIVNVNNDNIESRDVYE